MYQKTIIESADELISILGDQEEGSDQPSLSEVELYISPDGIDLSTKNDKVDISLVHGTEFLRKVLAKQNINLTY